MQYHIWITVRVPFDEGKFIARVVQEGFTIEAAAASGKLLLGGDNLSNAVIACRMEKANLTAAEMHEAIAEILITTNIQYCSLVVSEYTVNCIWAGGNITNDNSNPLKSTKKVVN